MKAMGLNTIKIWAQWRWNNPKEGEYYFDDLTEIMDVAHKYGIRVVINTIFDVAPAWLFVKHPDCCMVTQDGRVLVPQVVGHRQIGGAPGPCFHHDEAMKHSLAFLEAVVRQFKDHPALECWDLWNEPELTCSFARTPVQENIVCYCDSSTQAFKTWLQQKYKSIDNLNRYWNRNYNNWTEVEIPRQPSTFRDLIDWRMFFVETITDEMRKRAEIVKLLDKNHPVMCHTVPMPVFNLVTCGSDDWELAEHCDIFGNSVGSSPMAADLLKSAATGKMIINAEIHALPGNTFDWPEPVSFEEMKTHILTPLAHGVKGFLFWQYRPESLGLESPAWGLTDREGNITPWYESAVKLNERLQQYSDLILKAEPISPEIGILHIPENSIFQWAITNDTELHDQSVQGIYDALYNQNMRIGFVHAKDIIRGKIPSNYKYIYAPFPYYVPKSVFEGLKDWVTQGGTLVAECHLAGINSETGLHEELIPGYGLAQRLNVKETMNIGKGAAIDVYKSETAVRIDDGRVPIITTDSKEHAYGFFKQVSYVGDFKTLATFPGGEPAIVEKQYGKGKVILIGTLLAAGYRKYKSQETARLISSLLKPSHLSVEVTGLPDGIRWDLLTHETGAILVLTNSTKETYTGSPAITGVSGDKVTSLVDGNAIASTRSDEKILIEVKVAANDIEAYIIE